MSTGAAAAARTMRVCSASRGLLNPVDRPTSCAFGGHDGATLFVTTSRDGLDPAALARQPQAGHVLRIDALGVTGPPCTPCRGPVTPP